MIRVFSKAMLDTGNLFLEYVYVFFHKKLGLDPLSEKSMTRIRRK
jgi:hypothetical protein